MATPASRDAAPSAEELIQSVAREVEVTRRLYRSGESEYLIDGQVCRLRDVHDLLMDTGPRREGLRDHRAGQDRDDPQLAADRSAAADRGSGRRHEVQGAPARRRAEARGRAAEPDAHRRHRLRGREAARHAEAAGGKARRYQKLRDELRRWEKVLFARKYRQLAETIESARARLAEARERESAAAARVAEVEVGSRPPADRAGRGRVARDASARGGACARARHQPAAAADRVRPRAGARRSTRASAAVAAELDALEARREPARAALRGAPRRRPPRPNAERDRAAAALAAESEAYEAAHREIEGLEADVEAARSEVFSAINSATALRHALEHAAAARDRVAETLSKLDVETDDVRIESERVGGRPGRGGRRPAAGAGGDRGDAHRAGGARVGAGERAHRARVARALGARARARAGGPRGAAEVARGARSRARRLRRRRARPCSRRRTARSASRARSPTISRSRPATSAPSRRASAICSSTSSSSGPSTRPPGFELVREQGAGRCGFLDRRAERPRLRRDPSRTDARRAGADGLVALSSVVRVSGPFAGAIRQRDRRGVDRRLVRRAPRARAGSTRAAGRHARRRRVPRAAPRLRRRPRRGARHSRDQARDQGAARAGSRPSATRSSGSPRRPPASRRPSRRRRAPSPR